LVETRFDSGNTRHRLIEPIQRPWLVLGSALRVKQQPYRGHSIAISPRDTREVYPKIVARHRKGAGNAGRAMRVRSLVRKKRKHTSKSTAGRRFARHSPRDGFTAYFALSLVIGLSCHHRWQIRNRQLDASVEASGPRDFAVRFMRHSSKALKRPPHPASRL